MTKKKSSLLNGLLHLFWLAMAGCATTVMVFSSIYIYLKPGLPSVESLRDIRLQTPLRVYSQDMLLIGEFGEKRRRPISVEQAPELFIKAILAAEDSEFYTHSGVSIRGLMRAAQELAQSRSIQSGGSTLTMQVAREFFLTRDQRFIRKFKEILLSLQIERELDKNEILELYINKIFLGNRAYGFQAAANVYYGLDLHQLNLAQWAMLAGTPKTPSRYNPIVNPSRALVRRNWILKRMLGLDYISQSQYNDSVTSPVTAAYHRQELDLDAPGIAEMARKHALKLYGDAAYTDGYKIITTIDSQLQNAARHALQRGLEDYDQRHGYRGPEQRLDTELLNDKDQVVDALRKLPALGGLEPAVITRVTPQSLQALLRDRRVVEVPWENGLKGLRPYLTEDKRGPSLNAADEMFTPGDIVRLRRMPVDTHAQLAGEQAQLNDEVRSDPFAYNPQTAATDNSPTPVSEERWLLAQVPKAQGALISLAPEDGAIRALIGGYDFRLSHFNRATQATRQPGSSFKPFIYSAAIEKGYTAASIFNDAPINFVQTSWEEEWRPKNDDGTFLGPIRLREALYRSRNMVTIRLLQALGVDNALKFVEGFGFKHSNLPRNLSIALGSSALTPLAIARGYAAFANGGFRIEPYLINRVLDMHGEVTYQAAPLTVCRDCPESEFEQHSQENEPINLSATTEEVPTDIEGLEPLELTTQTSGANTKQPPKAPRAMSTQTAYIIHDMLKDVIKRGTGRRARTMKRGDIAGKTGTNNGPRDAWFSGYSPHLTTTVWVGFDDYRLIGKTEYGSSVALPIWIDYMSTALEGLPEKHLPQPEGIVSIRINPRNGLRSRQGGIFEIFRNNQIPCQEASDRHASFRYINGSECESGQEQRQSLPEELF